MQKKTIPSSLAHHLSCQTELDSFQGCFCWYQGLTEFALLRTPSTKENRVLSQRGLWCVFCELFSVAYVQHGEMPIIV